MIVTFPLDDQCVCLNTQTLQLSMSNVVGARILTLHTAGLSADAISATLCDEFDAAPELIENDVINFLNKLNSGEIKQYRPLQNYTPATDYQVHRELAATDHFEVYLPYGTVTVASESTQIIERLRPLFKLSPSVGTQTQSALLEVFEDDGRFPIVAGGQTLDIGLDTDDAAVICLRQINALAGEMTSHAFTFHAAAVALGQNGALLAARGGSGKSTLTAYLIRHGYSLINDDSVQFSETPLRMVPVPVPLSVKEGSWPVLSQWYPELQNQYAFGPQSHRIRYLPPEDNQVTLTDVPCSLVCFPKYRKGASTVLNTINRGNALASLIESGCYLPRPIEHANVQRLVDWAQSLTFCTLEYSDMADAEKTLRAALIQISSK